VGTRFGVVAHVGKTLGGGLGELRAALTEAGVDDVEWSEIAKSREAPKQIKRLLKHGVDRIIVWGGDGTVRRCIDAIVSEGADAELAILPAGTANLLANGLGVPIDLREALGVALQGNLRTIDVGVINGECFAVMAGTGFDALMIRDADADKQKLGRLAYIKAGAKHLAESGTRVVVEVDGTPWYVGPATCVLICNIGQIMGGVTLFDAARTDDGLLDVGIVTAERRSEWLRVGVRAATGSIDSSPLVETTQGAKVKVELESALPWELDGGARPKTKQLKAKVLPGRVSICVPTGVDAG
jgi:diacylglycerol kinase (ATP)